MSQAGLSLVAALLILSATPAGPTTEESVLVLLGGSHRDWSAHWKERRLRDKRTRYQLIEEDGELDPGRLDGGRISWRWKVAQSLAGNDRERLISGDDYAARVFVFFGPALFSPEMRAVCYVWANEESIGSIYPSPYSERIATIVLQSGDELAGEWTVESRDPFEDYRRAFGDDPPPINTVGLLVDTDDTGGEATAWFADLELRGNGRL